jgi:hypothetical protein
MSDKFHGRWSAAVERIYRKYASAIGSDGLEFWRGHIVWSDENLEDHSINWCLNEYEDLGCLENDKKRRYWDDDRDELIKESLRDLLLIPEQDRFPPGHESEE